jgi:hypothetical protein
MAAEQNMKLVVDYFEPVSKIFLTRVLLEMEMIMTAVVVVEKIILKLCCGSAASRLVALDSFFTTPSLPVDTKLPTPICDRNLCLPLGGKTICHRNV